MTTHYSRESHMYLLLGPTSCIATTLGPPPTGLEVSPRVDHTALALGFILCNIRTSFFPYPPIAPKVFQLVSILDLE